MTDPVPAGLTAVVSKNCVLKLAVNVAAEAGALMLCDCAPPSLQLLNRLRVPPDPCGELVLIVCEPPGSH